MNGSAAETDEAWANIRALPVSIALINLDLFISMSAKVENHGVAGHSNLPRQDINLKLVVVEPDKLGAGRWVFARTPMPRGMIHPVVVYA